MACLSYCFLGIVLLVGSLLMMVLCKLDNKDMVHFNSLLDDKQKQIYKSITKERGIIYAQGMIIGIIIGLLAIMYFKKLNYKNKVCLFILIALVTNLFYYKLYPKTTYMLLHLNNKEQVEGWLNIYKTMKYKYMVSILVALIGYLILGIGCC